MDGRDLPLVNISKQAGRAREQVEDGLDALEVFLLGGEKQYQVVSVERHPVMKVFAMEW
jgi:hypothetical protein